MAIPRIGHEVIVSFLEGDPDQPLTDQELEQKYRELAEPVIGKAKTEALLKDLWTLEQRKDCQLDYSSPVVNMKRA